MDPTALLNLERRTGIKDDDIDDFVRKASEVERALKGLMDGSLRPEDVKIDGIETEEEKRRKEEEREEKRRIQRQKEEELRAKRKQEERERWWAGAEIYKPQHDEEQSESQRGIVREENAARDRVVSRYTMDYSKWDTWEPDDEATREERMQKEKEEEERLNAEFERNNAEFCAQFEQDMKERQRAMQKKQESADILRLKGNRMFQRKDFQGALDLYMDALKTVPFDTKLLLNIAQAQIKLKQLEDALEFLSRTLYLDSHNIKALSRQAYTLCEVGRTEESLQSVNKALSLDPTNAELIAQQKEIAAIEQERLQERQLQVLSSAPTETKQEDNPKMNTSKQSENNQESDETQAMKSIESLKGDLERVSREDCDEKERETLSTRVRSVEKALNAFPLLKVHFKSCECVNACLSAIRTLSTIEKKRENENDKKTTSEVDSIAALLSLLNTALSAQRSAQQQFVDGKGYTLLRSLLDNLSESKLLIVRESLRLLLSVAQDDVCAKARATVLTDKTLPVQLSAIVGNLDFNLFSSRQWTHADTCANAVKSITLSLEILKLLLFSEDAASKASITTNYVFSASTLVCAAGCVLHHAFERATEKRKDASETHDLIELSIAVLVGLSRLENARPAFVVALPLSATPSETGSKLTNKKKDVPRSAVHVVVQVSLSLPAFATNALAILMNASLSSSEREQEVKQTIFRDGGLNLCLADYLSLTESERVKRLSESDGTEGAIFSRKAGLLSRLVSLPEVQQRMLEPSLYRSLVRRIANNTKDAGAVVSREKWMEEEHLHCIRILAALPAPSAELKAIAVQEDIFRALLSLFPQPREECGEITPTSVTLMPLHAATLSPQLVGNAARCFMPYADDPLYGEKLYKTKSFITIEKWICAMASCTDIRVRKNIAILLAKACRIPGVREKVSHFRGLQMMIELQDKL